MQRYTFLFFIDLWTSVVDFWPDLTRGTEEPAPSHKWLGANSPDFIYFCLILYKELFLFTLFAPFDLYQVYSEAILKLVHQNPNFFTSWHDIYQWKAESLCFKNLLEFLWSEVIWGRERSSKVNFEK